MQVKMEALENKKQKTQVLVTYHSSLKSHLHIQAADRSCIFEVNLGKPI